MTTDLLRTSGATIHYKLRGTGPLLLISQSGEGDADRSDDLADHLVDDFTVLTYDRRGLSRSTADNPEVTLADHADDVHLLLAKLTDEPAMMLGCSLGASIGFHLAVGHPEQLSTLVAHEPVTPRLLPPDQRAHHEQELAQLQEVYRREGLPAALELVAQVLGIDPADPEAEPNLTPRPMTPERIRNFGFFIEHDFTAVIRDTLDVAALRQSPTRIVPVAGRTTPPTVFDRLAAIALADLRGTDLIEFPGGHNGNLSHPGAYAEALRKTLA